MIKDMSTDHSQIKHELLLPVRTAFKIKMLNGSKKHFLFAFIEINVNGQTDEFLRGPYNSGLPYLYEI